MRQIGKASPPKPLPPVYAQRPRNKVASASRQKLASTPPMSLAVRCPQVTEIANSKVARHAANTARKIFFHPRNVERIGTPGPARFARHGVQQAPSPLRITLEISPAQAMLALRMKTSATGNPISDHLSTTSLTRRRFLRTTALAGMAAPFVLRAPARAAGAGNSKLHHASIGVGGMGWNDLNSLISHPRVQIVALCDVDANNLDKAAKLVPEATLFRSRKSVV